MKNLAALPSNTELVNDYRIDRVLGAGGFGITYLAHEIALNRRVTIKEYFPTDYAARDGGREASPRSQDCANDYRWGLNRFIEEAQALAKFNHPHIVRVYRYFKENNTGYMVLHFEEGESFKNWLKGLGRAPRQKELDAVVEPLLDALDLIHRQDILHRDIAPDNIIIRKDGSPVLIDFGSARCDIALQSKTVSALVKPGYSPYEQYAETSRQQGPWTDIYALGATLYHATTGKRPPDAPSRMVKDEYRPASEVALSSYRPRFLKAIDAALALNVESRPQSIGAWRGELLAPTPKPASPTRQGWLTKRNKKQKTTVTTDATSAATSHIPPPPDAPGPQGGIINFVDRLKQKPKREPLADALARVQAKSPNLLGEKPQAQQPAGNTDPSAASEVDAHARTQRYAPGGTSKTSALPLGNNPDSTPLQTTGGTSLETPISGLSKPDSGKDRKASANRKSDRRRPARPRPMPSRSRSAWPSFFVKVIAGAGIAGILIASRESLPSIDPTALLQTLLPSTTGTASSKNARSRKIETATINKRTRTRRAKSKPAAQAPKPQLNPLIRQTKAHERPVAALAYSIDGKTLITASKDKTLKVWDAATGALRTSIGLAPAPATAIAIQGQIAAVGHEDGLIEIFNFQTGTKKKSLQRNEAAIWSLTFTNQTGRLAAASHDWKTALWDLSQPQAPVRILEGHENAVQALAASNTRSYLATGGADRRVKLWNLNTFDLVRTYPRHNDFITALAFSPDGSKFASATLKGEIKIWSAKSRRLLRRLRGHKGAVKGLSFSPNGNLLTSAGSDGTVRLWSVKRGRTVKTLASHDGIVSALSFSPDGKNIASVGDDGHLRLWSTATAQGTR